MIVVNEITNDFDSKRFNQKAHHPLQSWEWGEARKKMGIEVMRIGEFENKRIASEKSLINVYQITFHKLPWAKYQIGYLPRSVFPSKEVLEFLKKEGEKRQCIFIKIEPYVKKSQIPNSKLQTMLTRSPHPLFPNWTIMLDLTKPEDELLKNMKAKTRYNIRLAEKKGVIVKEMTNEKGFEIFIRLYFETCKRQRYFGHNYDYHRKIFETLKNKIAHILIAFYNTTPLSAYEIFIFNDVLYYPYGGSSLAYRNFMGTNLLMWEVIKFGKKNGAKIFDMWGSLPPHYDFRDPWAGFTRFKEGYGGEFVELIGSYDLVTNRNLYPFYNLLHKIRDWSLKVKSRLLFNWL